MSNNESTVRNNLKDIAWEIIDETFAQSGNKEVPLIEKYLTRLNEALKDTNRRWDSSKRNHEEDTKTLLSSLNELFLEGYYLVNMAREKITNEKLEYWIGGVNKTQYYYAKLSLQEFVKAVRANTENHQSQLELKGSFTKTMLPNLQTIQMSELDFMKNGNMKKFYDKLYQYDKEGNNIYGLNRGQLYEVLTKAYLTKDFRTNWRHIRKIVKEAKNSIPYSKGGDFDIYQIKLYNFFNISNLRQIFEILTYYVQIFNNPSEGLSQEEALQLLFQKGQQQVINKILKDAYSQTQQEIDKFLKEVKLLN